MSTSRRIRACASIDHRHGVRVTLAGRLCLLAFVVACLNLDYSARAGGDNHVVLISIDGLAAYYLSDSRSPLPTLRSLAAQGAVAEAMRVSNPSVTWPNHTTLVTGVHPDKHSVLFNGLLVREPPGYPVRIEPDRNKDQLVAVPTLYDQLHQAGYRTAAVNWPCTRGAVTLDDNFPDSPDLVSQTTPRLREELIREKILDDGTDGAFLRRSAAALDQVWAASALHILQVRRPNLLLLHLVVPDAIQHRNGPRSPAAYTALALADALLANILRRIDELGIRERTTVVVTSDHGFSKPSKMINPNVVLRKAGLFRPGPRRRAQSVSHGGTAFVYLTQPASVEEDRAQVIALLRDLEGIAEIVQPSDYGKHRLPQPANSSQAGELLLIAKPGYTFSDEYFEDEVITPLPISLGSHGYPASNEEMDGVLIAWGRGIKPGVSLRKVNNVDIAPTIATLFGKTMEGTDGRVLHEILSDPAPR